MGSAVSSHSGVWGVLRVKERCWWHSRTVHGFKQQKTAFLYIFYEEIFHQELNLLSFCSHINVRVQAIEDPHNQFIVRVRTCGPSRDRRLGYVINAAIGK